MATHGHGRLETTARLVRFGKVILMDWEDTEDVYFAKTTVDARYDMRGTQAPRMRGLKVAGR